MPHHPRWRGIGDPGPPPVSPPQGGQGRPFKVPSREVAPGLTPLDCEIWPMDNIYGIGASTPNVCNNWKQTDTSTSNNTKTPTVLPGGWYHWTHYIIQQAFHHPDIHHVLGGELIKPEIIKMSEIVFAGTIWCSLHLNNMLLLFIYFPTWSAPILASKLRFLWFLLYLVVFTSKTGNW